MYSTWCWSGPHHTFPSTTARDRIESRKMTSRKIWQLIGSQKNGWWAQPYIISSLYYFSIIITSGALFINICYFWLYSKELHVSHNMDRIVGEHNLQVQKRTLNIYLEIMKMHSTFKWFNYLQLYEIFPDNWLAQLGVVVLGNGMCVQMVRCTDILKLKALSSVHGKIKF